MSWRRRLSQNRFVDHFLCLLEGQVAVIYKDAGADGVDCAGGQGQLAADIAADKHVAALDIGFEADNGQVAFALIFEIQYQVIGEPVLRLGKEFLRPLFAEAVGADESRSVALGGLEINLYRAFVELETVLGDGEVGGIILIGKESEVNADAGGDDYDDRCDYCYRFFI